MVVLTKNELDESLNALRYALTLFDYDRLYNVIFFNFYSLYVYMSSIDCKLPQGGTTTVGNILEMLEPYIPFALTDTTLEYFIRASVATTDSEMNDLEQQFAVRSKLDFLNIVRTASTPQEWSQVVQLCHALRSIYPAQASNTIINAFTGNGHSE